MQSQPYRLLDESEYLTLEARSPVRHEYVAGEIFAMTGASVRREKLRAYRTLPSLKEYALVSQDECKVELYRRRGDIGWDIITFEPGDPVEFASVELQMQIADVYFEAGVACSSSDGR